MQLRSMLSTGLLVLSSAGVLTAQGVLKDINTAAPTSDPSSSPNQFLTVGPTTYFAATTADTGVELFTTDGTAAGTKLLKDIYPGTSSSSPTAFTPFGGFVYFTALTDSLGRELWRTDGTAAGTTLVSDVVAGPNSSSPINLTVAGGFLYFNGLDSGNVGAELYATDGTTTGLVLDIYPGTSSSSPSNMLAFGGKLYFSASTPTNGNELWTSDGTAAGTVMVADCYPGTSSGSPQYLTMIGTNFLFAATDSTATVGTGRELWISDGTTAGTTLLVDINTGTSSSSPSYLSLQNGKVWFSATTAAAGAELWSSDGTAAGTAMLGDLNAGTASSTPYHFQSLGTNVLFSALTAAAGREPWVTDGTLAGTVMLADGYAGTSSSIGTGTTTPTFHVYGGKAVFPATTATTGYEPWVTDGTAAGTMLIADTYSGTSSGVTTSLGYFGARSNGVLFYSSNTTLIPGIGIELGITDGTPAGTGILININQPQASGSFPANFAELHGKSLFSATDGINGTELWVSDGTAAGTAMLVDIYPGASSSSPSNFIAFQGKAFFTATDSTATTGTGNELWMSDGTAAGTMLVKDIYPGTSSSSPFYLTILGDKLVFRATDSTATTGTGIELWISDGTTAGTVLLKDIYVGTSSSSPTNLRAAAGKVWFYANDGALALGSELWVTDGTAAGTVLVKDIYPGASSSSPNNFTEVNGSKVVFDALDGTATTGTGREIWVSDGTPAGTMLLADIATGTASSTPQYLTHLNGRCYFTAIGTGSGRELWVTDGTPAGTTMIKDIHVGHTSGMTNPIIKIGNRLLICGDDGSTGFELWRTDGTTTGTVLVSDLRPGPLGALPYPYGAVGNRILFSAFSDPVGEELFYVDFKTLGGADADPFGVGCAGTNGIPSLTGNPPRINNTFQMDLSSANASAPTVFVIGVGPTPTPIGGGCNLYVALTPILSWTTVTNASGNATLSLPVANDPNLLGFLAHAQNLTADPAGAWFNILSFSNALKLVVGN